MIKEKVLITGGVGFIGLHLVRRLTKVGYSVDLLDNLSPQVHGVLPSIRLGDIDQAHVRVWRGDVRDRDCLAELLTCADYVVHLAAETGTGQSMYDVALHNSVNSQGTAVILDWLVNNKHSLKRFVLASSRAVYGEGAYWCTRCGVVTPKPRGAEALQKQRWDPPCPKCQSDLSPIATPECAVLDPASIYAATKLAQENLVRICCDAAGIPWVTLRFQNVYGPGQSLLNPYTGILSIFSTRIRRGMALPIYEDGKESRDFVHVWDVADAIALCLERELIAGQVFNVGTGVPTTVLAVATALLKLLGGKGAPEVTGQYRLGDIRHCHADVTAIRNLVGFEPKVDLDRGLHSFVRWASTQPVPADGLTAAQGIMVKKGLMK